MNVEAPKVQFPEKAQVLFKPAPHKVFYGGRGASKTWDFARASLLLGANRKLFVLHAREIQKSIEESVYKLLCDQIEPMGLGGIYEPRETEIINRLNGTRHVFRGIRNNINAIKSMEAVDLAIVYEATFIAGPHWEIFLPTIRRDPPYGPFGEGSEVWVEFNPELLTDYTNQYWVVSPPGNVFRVKNDDDADRFIQTKEAVDTVVVECNWRDNPWFPEILRKQKEEMRKKDPDAYRTVWDGKTRASLQGAIYAREYAKALEDGRIDPSVKLIRSKPVTVAFDLGHSDMCAFWAFQQVGTEHNAVDFYGNTGYGIDHFIEEMQSRKYIVKKIYLPPDARAKQQSATKRGIVNTIEKQMREAYPGDGVVTVLPAQTSKVLGINAVRQLFPRINFNEQTCADGLLALQHYQYAVNHLTRQRSKEPLHNWASNPADALRYYAVGLVEGSKPAQTQEETVEHGGAQGGQAWMGG